MPRIMAVDAARSFTTRLMVFHSVSLVRLIPRVSTGRCRVVALETNAAGLSIESQNALLTQSTIESRIRS
jgi:hypothetical protein